MPKAPQNRRQKIIDSAVSIFIEQGVAHSKMADVAARARVDQALLRYHFPSLDSLYAEVAKVIIEHYVAYTAELMGRAGKDPVQMLRTYVKGYFDWAAENPGFRSLFLNFYYLASYNHEFTKINELTRHAGRERIAFMIYRMNEAGVGARSGAMDVQELSYQIQAIMIGGLVTTFTESAQDPRLNAERAWRAVSRIAGIAENS